MTVHIMRRSPPELGEKGRVERAVVAARESTDLSIKMNCTTVLTIVFRANAAILAFLHGRFPGR